MFGSSLHHTNMIWKAYCVEFEYVEYFLKCEYPYIVSQLQSFMKYLISQFSQCYLLQLYWLGLFHFMLPLPNFETVYILKIMVANKKQHQRFRLTSLMGYAIKDRKKDKGMDTERYIELNKFMRFMLSTKKIKKILKKKRF